MFIVLALAAVASNPIWAAGLYIPKKPVYFLASNNVNYNMLQGLAVELSPPLPKHQYESGLVPVFTLAPGQYAMKYDLGIFLGSPFLRLGVSHLRPWDGHGDLRWGETYTGAELNLTLPVNLKLGAYRGRFRERDGWQVNVGIGVSIALLLR